MVNWSIDILLLLNSLSINWLIDWFVAWLDYWLIRLIDWSSDIDLLIGGMCVGCPSNRKGHFIKCLIDWLIVPVIEKTKVCIRAIFMKLGMSWCRVVLSFVIFGVKSPLSSHLCFMHGYRQRDTGLSICWDVSIGNTIIDWITMDRLVDWSVCWSMVWFSGFMNAMTYWLVGLLAGWLVGWLVGWLINDLIDRWMDWWFDWMTEWLTSCLIDRNISLYELTYIW